MAKKQKYKIDSVEGSLLIAHTCFFFILNFFSFWLLLVFSLTFGRSVNLFLSIANDLDLPATNTGIVAIFTLLLSFFVFFIAVGGLTHCWDYIKNIESSWHKTFIKL